MHFHKIDFWPDLEETEGETFCNRLKFFDRWRYLRQVHVDLNVLSKVVWFLSQKQISFISEIL